VDELKILVDLVAKLPGMALWVIAFYFFYKIVVVGSIFGVVRYISKSLFSWLSTKKVEYKEIRPMIDGMCINAETNRLIAQLHRLRGMGVGIDTKYIHSQSVDWLREAIDAKIASEERESTNV